MNTFAATVSGASLILCATAASAQVQFPVSFDASAAALNETERAYVTSHMQAAGGRWVEWLDLDGARSIEIEVALDAAVPYASGISLTTALVTNEAGRDVFEQGAAHELRTGVDPNGPQPDARVVFNLGYLRNELWFDPDPVGRWAPVPSDRTDAMSTALHELGHVLAYNGWADGAGVPPATYWSTFDRWMLAGTPTTFDGPQVVQIWGSRPELTTGNIHHWANGPVPTLKRHRVPAPERWQDGVPLPAFACDGPVPADAPAAHDAVHAKGNLPPGLVYELMNGVVFYRGSRYDVSPLDRAAIADAGLPVKPIVFADGFEDD
jgi:hypothetical protein